MFPLLPFHFIFYGFDLGSSSFHSFIASIAALKTLKRRDFGKFQHKVFPYQFLTQSIAPGLIALTAPYTLTSVGIGLLTTSSIGGLLNLLYASPECQKIKDQRNTIIDTVYGGDDDKAKGSDDLKPLDEKFKKFHSWSLFFNMVSIASITAYSWVLSNGVLSLRK
ncbi:DEKNAAC100291 [Brettanomyces naardenensis]|uniref:DEKNAAC100291 n=1 Tax=Brettanomyces naardenensis TaxID=13370 RepID=A0A448YFN8_BRENA|nr:DEKNAAC100291 [Brettanomyces naardenensis]